MSYYSKTAATGCTEGATMTYRTKTTWLGREYGCRVYDDDVLVVEGRAARRDLIGATYRDLLRTLDKCGGDAFTSATRRRKYRAGNPVASVKHYWGGKSNAEISARRCDGLPSYRAGTNAGDK